KVLGKLAIRIFSTPVTSIASERASSIQNLNHTKICNALQLDRADKLAYTYTNGRILYRIDGQVLDGLTSKSLGDLSSDEEVALEELLLITEIEDRHITITV